MFGNKAKHALAAAQAENAQLKAQADTLQGELAATQARLAQLETQAQQSAMRQMLLDGVVGNLPRFGESLSGFRLSFSGLSEQLSDDAAMVHTAASESDANRAAFEKIAGNLHAMFERISVAGNSVEGLSRSAGEIGGIVQLIKEIAEQTNLLALNAAIEAAGPARRAAASQWWPTRCANWRNARPRRRQKSAAWSAAFRKKPATPNRSWMSVPAMRPATARKAKGQCAACSTC